MRRVLCAGLAVRREFALVGCLAVVLVLSIAPSAIAQSRGFSEQDVPASVVRDTDAPAAASANTASASDETAPRLPPRPRSTIPYTIRPGDTLGSVAAMFGLTPEALARSNRINPDDELIAGDELKVPNPFLAQTKSMQAQIESLNAEAQTAEQKADAAARDVSSLQDKNQELTGDNQTLAASLRVMPWWRATALGTTVAAILMFGVMVVTLFEWWRMRRRYVALANTCEDLGRLDYKYKAMLAKAELRLQQLYGRRRGGLPDGQPRPKLPEEIEIERLGEELRQVLEYHLVKLGARPRSARRRSQWREMLGDVEPRVEAPQVRR